jgi:hypothetical protein
MGTGHIYLLIKLGKMKKDCPILPRIKYGLQAGKINAA